MYGKPTPLIVIIAAALALAACQQQSSTPVQEQAPAAAQPAPAPMAKTEAPATTSAKPVTPAPAPAAKPAATAPETPKSETATVMTAKPESSTSKPTAVSTTASTFSTMKCMTCHAIDHVKVGPAWKDVVKAYGNEATLAKVFESGFAVKDRKIAGTESMWRSKAGLMTMQFDHLIKGHDKAAAHALFETVKHGKFGTY